MYEVPGYLKQIPQNKWAWDFQERMEEAHHFVRKHEGQEMEVDNFKMFCNPCSRRDVESKSTSWCSDCEEGLCSKCLEDHRVIKLTKSHHVVDMTEQISPEHYKLLSIPNCEIHEELRQDMVCKDHDLICCHQCFQSSHKSCKNVSHLDMAAKGIKQSDWLKKLGHDLKEMTKVSHKIIEERKVSKEELKNQVQKIKKEIANMKSKFIQHIDDLEKDLLSELATVDKDGEEESDKEKQELMNMEKEVQADHTALKFVTNNGSESQIYSFVQHQTKKQTEREMMLQKIPPSSKVQIELKEASHHIDDIKALGYLSVHHENIASHWEKKEVKKCSKIKRKGSTDTDYPNLILEKELCIDPKDFLQENERAEDITLNVMCVTIADDNEILVAGVIKPVHAVVNEDEEPGHNIHVQVLNKYDEDMNYMQSCCFNSSKPGYDSSVYALTCVPKLDRIVLLSVNHDGLKMKRLQSFCLSTFDVAGRRIQEVNLVSYFKSIIAQPDNTLLVVCNERVVVSQYDGTEIFSFFPEKLKAVTVDQGGNIFMLMADGIQNDNGDWKFSASSDQVSVQLTWTKTKAKEPEASSSKSKPALKSKPLSTRRRDAKRFDQWKATKTAVIPAEQVQQTTNTQTEARNSRSRIDYEDGFDIDHPDLLRTPPHTSPVYNEQSKEAIQSAIQAARPDTPYQQDQRSRSK
ncbi:unnamed protein product [Mytilus edulis]|uniref:B box-type domain-containing protein n=1 Tax=Mytilus edulis TaxID=6550 RepID=A0A8S3TB93_MYTED|nr:unnamed protein product [Mytilus edulis]